MSLDPSRSPIPAHILARMSPADRARYSTAPQPPAAALQRPATLPDLREVSADSHREEIRLQGEILSWLRGAGYEPCYPRPDRKSTLPLGWPDLTLASHGGRAVALEVKTPSGSMSPEQDDRHAAMRRAGWVVAVVRSLADVQQVLASIEAPPMTLK